MSGLHIKTDAWMADFSTLAGEKTETKPSNFGPCMNNMPGILFNDDPKGGGL